MQEHNQHPAPKVNPEAEDGEVTSPAQTQNSRQADLQVIMQQVAGLGEMPNLTQEQVNEVLSQRRKAMDYTRDDRKDRHERFHENSKTIRLFWISGLIFVLILVGLVLAFKPDLLSQLLALLIGGGGGYGVGRSTISKNQD